MEEKVGLEFCLATSVLVRQQPANSRRLSFLLQQSYFKGFDLITKLTTRVFLIVCAFSLSAFSFAAEPTIREVYLASQAGKYNEAQAMINQVLQAHPNSSTAYFVEAELLAQQGKFAASQHSLKKAEELSPGLPNVKPEALVRLKKMLATNVAGESTNTTEQAPKQLNEQVGRLVLLLSDGYAVGYPNATMYTSLLGKTSRELALVVFTVEGWGGGNSFTQFLAVFSRGTDNNEKEYFTFIDAMPVGGRGWRQVEHLDVSMLPSNTKGELLFAMKVKVNLDQDPPNFPSKKSTAIISLRDGKLKDVGPR